MAKDVQNKTIVITGGAAGIGYEIADNFLQKNPKVVIILDINEKLGAEACNKLTDKYGDNKAVFYKCDVTKDLEVVFDKLIETFITVDVLVNNAGMLDDYYLKKTIDINVTALMEWSFKFWHHMRKDKSGNGGTIINIASIFGNRIEPYLPVYHASKFAVMGFTKSLGHNYNFTKFGVRVVAICPGHTSETNLGSNMKTLFSEANEDLVAHAKKQIWQKPDAVGRAAVEVFETADSGSAWLIEGAQPITQVK